MLTFWVGCRSYPTRAAAQIFLDEQMAKPIADRYRTVHEIRRTSIWQNFRRWIREPGKWLE